MTPTMRFSSISFLIVSVSFTFLRVSHSFHESEPELVAKCGYICWLKYGIDGPKDLYVNVNRRRLSPINLDDYEIGELRGCMEECLAGETETDSTLDESF